MKSHHGHLRCPACGEIAVVPVLYGPLPESLTEDHQAGHFRWGGLVLRPDSPRWICGACERDFASDAIR